MRYALLFSLFILASGCASPGAGTPNAQGLPPFHVGDHASYSAASTGVAIDLQVRGYAQVLDVNGSEVRALLLDRWVNQSSLHVAFHEVDAIRPDTGDEYWTTQPCGFPSGSSPCNDQAAIYFGLRGVPGMAGRAWAERVLRNASLQDDVVRHGDCFLVMGTHHPVRERQLLGYAPAGWGEGGNATFCAGSPFPTEFQDWTGTAYVLVLGTTGSGERVPDFSSAEPLPPLPAVPLVPWDHHRPPEPEWPGPFGIAEAWSWLEANSTEFRGFLSQHPDAYLHTTSITGGTTFDAGVKPASGILNQDVHQRTLVVQAPSGEALTLTLQKTDATTLQPSAIKQTQAQPGRGVPTLDPSRASPQLESTRDATQRVLDRVPGEWTDTAVITGNHGPNNATFVTGTHYDYRVVLVPPGTPEGTHQYFSNLAIVRGDTGEWIYVVGPPRLVGLLEES